MTLSQEFRGAYGALLLRCRFSADCRHLAGDPNGADCALTAVDLLNAGERSAFVLTRGTPGHHAGRDFFGGYCFLNHAAIAAQALRDAGCARVAILDVDYHHGSGTQDIFYDRSDVLFVSIHGDPLTSTRSFSVTPTNRARRRAASIAICRCQQAPRQMRGLLRSIRRSRRMQLSSRTRWWCRSVSTPSRGDPISHFKLKTADYPRMGERIAALRLPTLFAMEGWLRGRGDWR